MKDRSFLLDKTIFLSLLYMYFCLALQPALAKANPKPPVFLHITGLVVADSSNSSILHRARLGYDFKNNYYFIKSMRREYPIHKHITSSIFWIGEEASSANGWVSNLSSAWDEDWPKSFGGVDDPVNRKGYWPSSFVPRENPFYAALPYNDFDDQGNRKADAVDHVYWVNGSQQLTPGRSIVKNRWIKIVKDGKEAYAQWEDAGPFGEDDWPYVFGNSKPFNKINDSAGIDLSPAVRDYLGLKDIDKVEWQFVDFDDVPPGPWLFVTSCYGSKWYHPVSESKFYWQLQGDLKKMDYEADIYDIDLFDTPVGTISELKSKGKRVICYFSAGSSESWREDFAKFNKSDLGKPLDKWNGERWLDIRSENVRQIILSRLDLAVEKGCDGVEPDNVDGFTNDTGFSLTYEDQLTFNKFLAQEAHKRGLAIFLKNDLEQALDLVRYFDGLLLESCMEYSECMFAAPFIQSMKPVFDVEYDKSFKDGTHINDKICKDAEKFGIHLMLMNEELDGSFLLRCP